MVVSLDTRKHHVSEKRRYQGGYGTILRILYNSFIEFLDLQSAGWLLLMTMKKYGSSRKRKLESFSSAGFIVFFEALAY